MSLMSTFKGFIGEAMGSLAHKMLLDKTIYRELNNVTIPTPDGTTQIDHVIVSRFGIFVIEAKNMNGWIFGDEKSAQWTQSFPGGKFKFQNPLRQNYRHTKCLSEFLGVEHEKLHSVVMFWGETTFKTEMPANVLDKGYTSYIKSKTDLIFSDDDVDEIVEAIQTGKLPRTWATRKQHIASLKERHLKSEAKAEEVSPPQPQAGSDEPICPLCNSPMVKRSAKRGANAGNQFWGCSRYPGCKGIVSV
ncbi:MAG: NERD domain-containing protein [Gammaproteobacteria bacterium]|nr:NERD domain-containing protein [Gammaproteobacteria bacterium]